MSLTDYGEQLVLNLLAGGSYVSLHTGVADPFNEVLPANNYARRPYGSYAITPGDPSQATNSALIEFATASGFWGNIQGFGLWDDDTEGNLLLTGVIPIPKTVDDGDVVRFPPGTLTVTAR